MKIPTLKNLQNKTNKILYELAENFVKISTEYMPDKRFEQTKEKIYKKMKKVQPDVQFLDSLEKAKE